MFRNRSLTLFLLAACVLALPAQAAAQSGRTPPPPTPTPAPAPGSPPAPTPTPDHSNMEKVKVIKSDGFRNFVSDLNEQGRAGYRLERSVSYGGRGAEQTFAAVLRLDPGHAYDYDWLSSPNRNLLDLRLNTLAGKGFNFADTYPVTACSDDEAERADDPATVSLERFQFLKGNVFLFARRDGGGAQEREYRFYTSKLGPGKNPKETIQAALDASPPGFRPVRVLFSKTGWVDFRVSVLLERDLREAAPAKVEYEMVKEVRGFEKEVNKLAAGGFRLVAGGRSGMVNFGVLARPASQASEATVYTFLDDKKHAREFDRTVAAGNAYHGLLAGAQSCDDWEVANQKLVFARDASGAKREYKVLDLLERKTGALSAAALGELRRLDAEGFRFRDVFYARGLYAVFER